MAEQSKALKIEVTTTNGVRHLISPLRSRTVIDLAEAAAQAGADGICVLKGADGNLVTLVLSNLAAIEAVEVDLPD